MRRALVVAIASALIALLPGEALARAAWKREIDRLVAGRSIGVAVRDEGRTLYRHSHKTKRIPASNEKLLLSMALFDRLEPSARIRTSAAATTTSAGRVEGDLWLMGRGDPTITGGGRYGRSLPFEPTGLGELARAVAAAGITSITGNVVGSTGYYARDWYAQGWKPYFPVDEVPLPSALTFEGNVHKGDHVADPELRAARSFVRKLRSIGVTVGGEPAAGPAPSDVSTIAFVESQPLEVLFRFMNRKSSNYFAEVLGKRLAVERYGPPGTIADGARAIEAWTRSQGVTVVAHDSSGLSYDNRVSPGGMARLIGATEAFEWGEVLRELLPSAGEGTLEDRLNGVKVRAKTGTLTNLSTLSGWVWLRKTQSWAEFSIMSRGMAKTTAAGIENEIVRILTRSAR